MRARCYPVSYLRWYRSPDSNRDGVLTPTVFETAASTVPPLRRVLIVVCAFWNFKPAGLCPPGQPCNLIYLDTLIDAVLV